MHVLLVCMGVKGDLFIIALVYEMALIPSFVVCSSQKKNNAKRNGIKEG